MNYTETLGLIAATLTTAAFIPQVYKAWKHRSTKDISLIMYIVLTVGLSLWLLYGMAIGSLPVMLANAITLLLVISMVVLKIIHK
jgi:MtN3 and saliva related transmembrane protein